MVRSIQCGLIFSSAGNPSLQSMVLPYLGDAVLRSMDATDPQMHRAEFFFRGFDLSVMSIQGRVDLHLTLSGDPAEILTPIFDFGEGIAALRDIVINVGLALNSSRIAFVITLVDPVDTAAEARAIISSRLHDVLLPSEAIDVDLKVNVRMPASGVCPPLNRIIRWHTMTPMRFSLFQDGQTEPLKSAAYPFLAMCTIDVNTAPEVPLVASNLPTIYDNLAVAASGVLTGEWSKL